MHMLYVQYMMTQPQHVAFVRRQVRKVDTHWLSLYHRQ